MSVDHTYIRDWGVKSLMPYLDRLSLETLIVAVSVKWPSITDLERAILMAELHHRCPGRTFVETTYGGALGKVTDAPGPSS